MICKVLFFIFLTTGVVVAIVCPPNFCENEKLKCPPEECKAGQVLKPGGFCNCCMVCHTILKEGDSCSSFLSKIRGGPPPTVYCGEGLQCVDNKCQKINYP